MLTPSVSTFADYSEAILSGKRTHVKLTAVGQNIVFEDEDIELSGGLNITSFLNGDVDLTIGRAVMTELVVYLFRNSKVQNIQWSGQFLLEMGVEISGTLASTEWVTVGTFYGKRPERYEQDNVIEFHLCDAVSKLNVPFNDYANTISFTNPVSVSDLYSGICTYCGLQKVSGDELPNIMSRSYSSALPISDNGLTCRDVIALIAEACGCYARATNDGKIKMVWYSDHMDDYTVTGDDEFDIHVTEVDFVSNNSLKKTWTQLENFTWDDLRYYLWGELEGNEAPFKINALNVRMMQEDSGVLIPSAADRNIYMIVDNHFLETANATEVTNYLTPIYNRLGGFGSYIPMDITCVGNWLIEVGDIITVEVGSNNMVRLPIFTRTFKWNGSPTDTYEATGNLERETITPYVNEKMVSGGRMHVIQQSIDRTYERIQDELGNYSTQEQTAQAIQMAVASKADIVYSRFDPYDATAYSSSSTYQLGQFTLYDSKLWICISAIATAEEWNEDHWKRIIEDTIWVDTSVDSGTNLPVNMWYRYTGGNWVSVDETNVYERVSGITIDSNGVTITGNKNIKLNSGLVEVKAGGNTYQMNQYGFVFTNGNSAPGKLSVGANPRVGDGNLWTVLESITYPICIYAYNNEAQIGGSKTKLTLTGGGYFLCEYNRYNQPRFVFSSDAKACCGDDDHVWHQVWSEQFYGDSYDQRSSRELKHNIKEIEECGERLDRLTPVTFTYKNDKEDRLHSGMIYEDTIEVFPEICHEGKLKTIDYTDLIPYLLKEIQSLRRRIYVLEN